MDAQRWLDELRAELAQCKLPSHYVVRLVEELSDHFSDCMEDRMSTDAHDLHGVYQRLGSPRQVAKSAAEEHRRARFSRRHPVLMFVVLPVVSLPLLWAAKIVAVILFIKLLGIRQGEVDVHSSVWQFADAMLPCVMVGITAIPVALAAAFFCLLARRAEVSWKWSLTACLLLAVVGGMAIAQFTLPTATTKGSLSFGLGLSLYPGPAQALQFLLPLAICGWAIWRRVSGSQRSLQHA